MKHEFEVITHEYMSCYTDQSLYINLTLNINS